jgi:CheY-like chemotaxis protein
MVDVRCVIVDDNAAFLVTAQALLDREGLTVVGVASSQAEALKRVDELRPDVVLIDIDLGPESGFAVARELLAVVRPSPPRLILVSAHPQDDFAELVEQSPAIGFIAKTELSGARIVAMLDGRQTSD